MKSPHARRNQRTIAASLATTILLAMCPPAHTQLPFEIPEPKPENHVQKRHTNFFTPQRVYDFQTDQVIARDVPAGLSYKLYSAVGFNLANSMMLIGPNGGVVIVDTLGDTSSAEEVAGLFLDKYRQVASPNSASASTIDALPIEAIIYTHNHIDHTGGVQGFLAAADRPVCPPERADARGEDGAFLYLMLRDRPTRFLTDEQVASLRERFPS